MEKNQFGDNMFIGDDGKSYSSPEELARANAMFENRQTIMENLSMIQMLEQLRRDINADIERRKLAYIGKDGKDYSTSEELEVANKRYNDMMFPREENKLLYPDPIPREQIYYDDLDTSHKRR